MFYRSQHIRLSLISTILVTLLFAPVVNHFLVSNSGVALADTDSLSDADSQLDGGVTQPLFSDASDLQMTIVIHTPTPTETPVTSTPIVIADNLQQAETPTLSPTPCALNTSMAGGTQQIPREVAAPIILPSMCIDGNDQFFTFQAKANLNYVISTLANPPSLDTHLFLYADSLPADLSMGIEDQSDDISPTNLNSEISLFQSSGDRTYFVRVVNKTGLQGAYTFEIELTAPPTATPTNTPDSTERLPGDDFEDNFGFEAAAVIAPDTEYDLNFVPVTGEGPDNDFFRLWVKEQWYYSCETFDLSPYNDTNMIIYDQNQNGLAGNDDKQPNDLGSRVNYVATYTGWLYLLIGPNVEIEYGVSDQYTYKLQCSSSFGTPTPTPRPTLDPAVVATYQAGATAAAATAVAQATANAPTPTFTPVSNPITVTIEAEIPDDPLISIMPLDSENPSEPPIFNDRLVVTVLATGQEGQLQGIGNMPVALYGENQELIAFGYTDLNGNLIIEVRPDTRNVVVFVPYLGIRKEINYQFTKLVTFTVPAVE